MSFWIKLAVSALAAYALLLVTAYLAQRKLMYFPDTARVQPAQVGLANVFERVLKTPDGERIIAWYGKATPGQPTLLYFHGNGGSLAIRAPRIARFMEQGWGVYMMTYRGYGGGSGQPTEVDNVADARLAYGDLLLEGVPPASIIAYGESLGSNIAVRIGIERKVAGVILDAPYTSIVDVAARAYPFVPVRAFLTDRYETSKYIANLKVPLLILHGEHDQVVPVAMGRELARLANVPKRLVTFPNGGHSNLYIEGNNAIEPVRQWISELEATTRAGGTDTNPRPE
jgi:pimeloyl-ACP methyl ester carboxylesterase